MSPQPFINHALDDPGVRERIAHILGNAIRDRIEKTEMAFNLPSMKKKAGVTRYLRDDIRNIHLLTKEKRDLWEAHYPIPHQLPATGKGMTLDELEKRVRWYCTAVGIKLVAGIGDALDELIDEGLVLVVKSDE